MSATFLMAGYSIGYSSPFSCRHFFIPPGFLHLWMMSCERSLRKATHLSCHSTCPLSLATHSAASQAPNVRKCTRISWSLQPHWRSISNPLLAQYPEHQREVSVQTPAYLTLRHLPPLPVHNGLFQNMLFSHTAVWWSLQYRLLPLLFGIDFSALIFRFQLQSFDSLVHVFKF